jgi:hypothetical protein
MKRCTWCGKKYPDEAIVCSLDQQPLELIASPSDTPSRSSPQARSGWPPQVVIPAVIWVISYFVLVAMFSVVVGMLFGFLTAVWAAIDCSKLQSKNTRVLSIAFKPVVVFTVVAFLFYGFGFVWYLVMRNRINTAPIEVEVKARELTA